MFFARFKTNREEISIWSDFTRRIRYLFCLSVFRKLSTYVPGISEPPWQITCPKIRKFADFRFFSRFSVFQAVLTSNFGEIPMVTTVCQTNKKTGGFTPIPPNSTGILSPKSPDQQTCLSRRGKPVFFFWGVMLWSSLIFSAETPVRERHLPGPLQTLKIRSKAIQNYPKQQPGLISGKITPVFAVIHGK